MVVKTLSGVFYWIVISAHVLNRSLVLSHVYSDPRCSSLASPQRLVRLRTGGLMDLSPGSEFLGSSKAVSCPDIGFPQIWWSYSARR